MIKNFFGSIFVVSAVLMVGNITSVVVQAKEKVDVSDAYYTSPQGTNEQIRFISVTKDTYWTDLKTVKGQPTYGTYVYKGDALVYNGIAFEADSSGYYLLKNKKNIQPTIVYKQYRHRLGGYFQQNAAWGDWEEVITKHATIKNEVIQDYSELEECYTEGRSLYKGPSRAVIA